MGIETAARCLTWSGNEEVWRGAYREYLDFVGRKFVHAIYVCEGIAPAHAERLKTLLAEAPDAVFTRFLTAPEVTNRVLWQPMSEESAAYLVDGFEMEMAAANGGGNAGGMRWSPLGDSYLNEHGRLERPYVVENFVPLDFGSPGAETMARSEGFVEVGTPETRGFDPDEIAALVQTLARVRDVIGATSEEVHRFVVTFNRVLILQRDPGAPEGFASGSTGQYIGRSFLANPQLDFVDEAQLADAIVHEGIHGFLYMQEVITPWVLRPELYDTTPVVVSPWTGNRLALRPFLQACFVWFGLANFFARALQAKAFPEHRTLTRLRIAASGFLKEDLQSFIEPFRDGISPAVAEAVQSMQSTIRTAYAD